MSTWKQAIVGTFYIFRYLKDYTVFLDYREPPKAYGVTAIAAPLEELLGPVLPVLTQAVLLPFKGKIVYDGLLTPYRIIFGPGIRKNMNASLAVVEDIVKRADFCRQVQGDDANRPARKDCNVVVDERDNWGESEFTLTLKKSRQGTAQASRSREEVRCPKRNRRRISIVALAVATIPARAEAEEYKSRNAA